MIENYVRENSEIGLPSTYSDWWFFQWGPRRKWRLDENWKTLWTWALYASFEMLPDVTSELNEMFSIDRSISNDSPIINAK